MALLRVRPRLDLDLYSSACVCCAVLPGFWTGQAGYAGQGTSSLALAHGVESWHPGLKPLKDGGRKQSEREMSGRNRGREVEWVQTEGEGGENV